MKCLGPSRCVPVTLTHSCTKMGLLITTALFGQSTSDSRESIETQEVQGLDAASGARA